MPKQKNTVDPAKGLTPKQHLEQLRPTIEPLVGRVFEVIRGTGKSFTSRLIAYQLAKLGDMPNPPSPRPSEKGQSRPPCFELVFSDGTLAFCFTDFKDIFWNTDGLHLKSKRFDIVLKEVL